MPNLYIARDDLKEFVRLAIKTPTTWFKPRKILWEQYQKILRIENDDDAFARGEMVEIPYQLHISVKGTLLARSQNLTSDQVLSFETSIDELNTLADSNASEESKGEGKNPKKDPSGSKIPRGPRYKEPKDKDKGKDEKKENLKEMEEK